MHSKYTLLVKKSTLAAALGAAVIALAACQPVSPTGASPTTVPAATTPATAATTAEATVEATAEATATADAS